MSEVTRFVPLCAYHIWASESNVTFFSAGIASSGSLLMIIIVSFVASVWYSSFNLVLGILMTIDDDMILMTIRHSLCETVFFPQTALAHSDSILDVVQIEHMSSSEFVKRQLCFPFEFLF